MKYTIDNYEEFAIDYLEGNLKKSDRQEFEAFLILHPEIKEAFEDFNWVELPNFESKLPSKEKLYRRKVKVIPVFSYVRAIAAAIVLLLIFGLFMQKKGDEARDQIVVIDKKMDPQITETPPQEELPSPKTDEPIAEKTIPSVVAETTIKPRTKKSVPAEELVNKSPNSKQENAANDLALDFSVSKADEKAETQRFQTVVYIESIKIRPAVENYYQIENRPTYLFLEPEKKEDTVSKIGRLLAKANLIPTGLREEITESNLREKVIPESYMDLK